VGGLDRPQAVAATTSNGSCSSFAADFEAQDDAYQEYEKVKETSSNVAPPTRAVTGAKIGVNSKSGRQSSFEGERVALPARSSADDGGFGAAPRPPARRPRSTTYALTLRIWAVLERRR
jgi:hypothetical protein